MEFAIIFFLTIVGLGNEIEKNNVEIEQLQKEVSLLDEQFLNLAVLHSSFYADQHLINDKTKQAISNIEQDLENHDHPHDH